MSKKSFYQTVAFTKELNPFHSLFSYENVKDLLTELSIEDPEFGNNLDYICYIISTNKMYKEFCSWLQKYSKTDDLRYFYLGILIFTNRDFVILAKTNQKYILNSKLFNPINEFKQEIQTTSGNKNHINDLLDINTDILNFVFSLLRFIEIKIKKLPNSFPPDKVNEFYNFYQISNRFTVLKDLFEQICLEDNTIKKKDDTYFISSKNNKFLLKNISRKRIEQQCMFTANEYIRFKELHGIPHQFKHTPELVNVTQTKGFLKLDFTIGDNIDLDDQVNNKFFFVESFYPFLSKEYKSIIMKNIIILVFLQQIIKKAFTNTPDESTQINYDNYQFKILPKDIVIPLSKILKIDVSSVLTILKNNFENDGTKSFWERPIYRFENNYYLIANSILGCNIFNIFDCWIENLSEFNKGTLFEDYVKETITEACKQKNFFSNICQTKKYKGEDGEQEIDLVWETKNTIVIGECKCIKYSFNSRDIYYSNKTIKKAVEQVKLKTDFLKRNKDCFPKLNLTKKIVRVVITNYPLYTGLILDDIPIIDFRVLSSYIEVGYNAQGLAEKGILKTFNQINFYNTEDEFSDRIEKYITTPDVVETFKKYITTTYRDMDVFPNLQLKVEDIITSNTPVELPED